MKAARNRNGSGRTIDLVKREVIGTFEGGGDKDLLATFAEMAMRNARDDMRDDSVSRAIYEVTDDFGTTEITIEHTPEALTHPPLTVDEAKTALTVARRRARDDLGVMDEAAPMS